MNKRWIYVLLTILFVIVEVLIALYVHDEFIRPYIGDVLVVVVLYTFVRIFIPENIKWLPLYIFIFASFVECMQLIGLVNLLGFENNAFMRVLMGSVFDIKDILCYGVGCLLLDCVERNIQQIKK